MADRRLGDVPGIDALLPSSALLQTDNTVMEVNALGELTNDAFSLGGFGSSDPFAVTPGFLDSEGVEGRAAGADPMQSSYLPPADGYVPSYDSSGAVSTAGFDEEQVANAQTIARVGRELGASDRDIQIALMAAIVESGLRNVNYGDRDSLGLFQQRDAWGTSDERLDPATAARMFFLGGAGGQEGLLDIADRDKRGMGEVAQDVQVSAYPERYAEHESEAASLMAALSGKKTRGRVAGDPYALTERDGEQIDNMTAAALDAATKVFGGDFRIMQGSHSHDVAASGNTHAGGGVVDLDVPNGDWVGAMTALRKIGFAAWVRNVPGFGQAGSGAHIHAVLIGNEQLSPEAQTQVQSYLNNDDGLSGDRPDDGPREFVNNRFVWGQPRKRNQWRDQVTKTARGHLGVPFAWGGEDVDGIDDVGLVRRTYKMLGVDLPKTAFELAYAADPIEIEDAQPGDLIAWDNSDRLGIYVGNGQVLEAGGPGRVVQLNELGGDILNAWGVPMQSVIERKQPAPPAPVAVSSTGSLPLQGQMNAPVPAGGRTRKPPKPNPEGPLQDTTFDQKPHLMG